MMGTQSALQNSISSQSKTLASDTYTGWTLTRPSRRGPAIGAHYTHRAEKREAGRCCAARNWSGLYGGSRI